MKQGIKNFFTYARLRHEAYLAKQRGVPKGQQSKDPILNEFKFTNVFRELDRTTRWFADNVREPMRDKPEVLLATVLFRLLNRTEVGEAIFLHDSLLDESSAFHELVRACSLAYRTDRRKSVHTAIKDRRKSVHTAIKGIERAVKAFVGKGPYVTGGYIITSPQGMSKLPGVLSVVENFALSEWNYVAKSVTANKESTLEDMWNWLKTFDYFGSFHSYEMVTDLRHTVLLDRAPDIMTWANPGPGCLRGLNRVHGRAVRGGGVTRSDTSTSREHMLAEMRELLTHSSDPKLWPVCKIDTKKMWLYDHEWPTWEMRDVEHTLCEFDKYERTRLGHGRPRGVYR